MIKGDLLIVETERRHLSLFEAALMLFKQVKEGEHRISERDIDEATKALARLLDEGLLSAEGKKDGLHVPMSGCWQGADLYPSEFGGLIHIGSALGERQGDTLTIGSGDGRKTWTNVRLQRAEVLSFISRPVVANPHKTVSGRRPRKPSRQQLAIAAWRTAYSELPADDMSDQRIADEVANWLGREENREKFNLGRNPTIDKRTVKTAREKGFLT
jgi:hypothetical protein